MAQEFAETERTDHSLHSATVQRGVGLTREHFRGRSGDHNLYLLGIQHATHKTFPAGNNLNLVEEPVHRLASTQSWETPEELFEQESQLIQLKAGKCECIWHWFLEGISPFRTTARQD